MLKCSSYCERLVWLSLCGNISHKKHSQLFLVDFTCHLNTLYKNLQGKDGLVSQMHARMKSFVLKLRLFEANQ